MRHLLKLIFTCAVMLPVATQAQVTPGQWQATYTVNSMEMPGAPPQVAQMMKNQMGQQRTMSYCITPEQAAKGPQEMLKQAPTCRFTKYSMAGGQISSEMTCSQQGGGAMTARANGSYTLTSFNVTSSAVMTGGMSMRMTTTSSGKRIGPCTGK